MTPRRNSALRAEHGQDGEQQGPEHASADLESHTVQRSESLVDLGAPHPKLGFDPLETMDHLVEALVDVLTEIVKPLVGSALPHRLHDGTLADKKLRQAKPRTRLELVTPSLPWKCSTN